MSVMRTSQNKLKTYGHCGLENSNVARTHWHHYSYIKNASLHFDIQKAITPPFSVFVAGNVVINRFILRTKCGE